MLWTQVKTAQNIHQEYRQTEWHLIVRRVLAARKKKAVKGKRTSSIVDLSFSDDDDNGDHRVREKSYHVINLHASSSVTEQQARLQIALWLDHTKAKMTRLCIRKTGMLTMWNIV